MKKNDKNVCGVLKIEKIAHTGFKKWGENCKYRKLYDVGMLYIEKIHEVTHRIKEESHDQRIHASTFLSQVPQIPEIHSRAINILLDGILCDINPKFDRDKKDLTYLTQLFLGLRVLAEVKIDTNKRLKIINYTEERMTRFQYIKLKPKVIKQLNTDAYKMEELVNSEIVSKYYMAHYCYCLEGEYADPDASIYEVGKHQKGNVITTNYTFVPRSKLAKEYYSGKIKKIDVAEKMRYQRDKSKTKQRLDSIKELLTEKNKSLKKLNGKFNDYNSKLTEFELEKTQNIDKLNLKIEEESKNLKQSDEFLPKLRKIEIEEKKLKQKQKEQVGNKTEKYFDQKNKFYGKWSNDVLISAIPIGILLWLMINLTLGLVTAIILLAIGGVLGYISYKFEERKQYFISNKKRLSKEIREKVDRKVKEINKIIDKRVRETFTDDFKNIDNSFENEQSKLNNDFEIDKLEVDIRETKLRIDKLEAERKGLQKDSSQVIKSAGSCKKHPILNIYLS